MRVESTHHMMSWRHLDRSDNGRLDPTTAEPAPVSTAHDQPSSSNRAHRAIDVGLATAALTLLSPLILIISIAIKLDSRGPVFYRQLRIGLDRRGRRSRDREDDPLTLSRRTADLGGDPFTIYKFRTMHLDAEDDTGPVWATEEDVRVTRVGRSLRPYRLDEIPQFLNVLRGEMSIVGPRPERPSFVHVLRNELEEYPLRHRVPPGITGWAQVNQEPDQTLDDVRQKLEYDLEYLRRRSLSFDLRIMLQTVPVMLERWSSRK
jgi:lipopolysaccharide/colanic/teichoic acid biosynthesis glycosyltransferase